MELKASAPTEGERHAELAKVLYDAFDDVRGLGIFVAKSLGAGLHRDYVTDGLTLAETTFELVEVLDTLGTTRKLIHDALVARPDRKDLRDRVARFHPDWVPSDTELRVKEVGDAIRATGEGLGDPAVRALVEESWGSVARLRHDVDVLARYKELHDCLHQVQLKHFRQVADAARRFRADPLAGGTLEEYLDQLRTVVSDAREAAGGLPDTPSARPQELLWVDTLDAVAAGLRAALDTLDDRAAADAVRKLKTLLRTEPFRVNQMLALTAQGLPLKPLLETLRRVAAAVGSGSRDLAAGVAALEALIPDLLGHVQEHWRWQEVEKDLWHAEDSLHQGSEEAMVDFELLWPGITSRVRALAAADPAAPWAVDVGRFEQALAEAMPAAPAAPDPVRARMAFDRYRRSVLYRFYLVDKGLKEKCGKVTAIGEPLDNLLRQVPDGSR